MRASASAPGSVANVAVGFDMLGHALEGLRDIAHVTRTHSSEVRVIRIDGPVTRIPLEAVRNTGGRALLALRQMLPPKTGFDLELEKGIPLSSGLGGSAASAVAAVVAGNATLEDPLPTDALYQCAMEGEAAASGSKHGDNVGPALVGGLVICPSEGGVVPVPVPLWLHAAVVYPHFELETRRAREALAGSYALKDFVHQSEGLALVLAGCFQNDAAIIRRGLRDTLVEPRRAHLIPGFAQVKTAAIANGALGAGISGAGPSVFGWFTSKVQAEVAGRAMVEAFAKAGLGSDATVSKVSARGAEILAPARA